jgi:uracil-DNA glycosylase
LDGGAYARLLILLETPSPGNASIRFVSRDNSSDTARNLRRFLDAAGIDRRDMVLWNAVPWIIHPPGAWNRPLRRAETMEGLARLPDLVYRLPRLKVVLLAGRVASTAADRLAQDNAALTVIPMPHPSPANVCTSPSVADRIQGAVTQAAAVLGGVTAACP